MEGTRLPRKALATLSLGGALALGAAAVPAMTVSASASTPSAKTLIVNPGKSSVTETGSTLLYPLFNIWVPGYNHKFSHVQITTAGTGSGTGISDATNGTVDIGASDAYLSPSERTASPHLLNIPLAISAQSIVYNVPGVTANLKLTGKVIAEIYQGKITNWDNSAIAGLNHGVKLPNLPIVTVHRSDGSGDTFLFTQFLSRTDPTGWGQKIAYGTTVAWPNVSGALGEQGNSGMVSGCGSTKGCIAYVGISYRTQVLQAGLGQAELQNARGKYVLPTATTIKDAAASFARKTPANGTISMIYGSAEDGYPIVNYEYAIVSKVQHDTKTATAIRSVLAWAVDPNYGNSSDYLSQVNFQPLPSKVEAQSLVQISSIR